MMWKAIVMALARVRDWFRGSLVRPAPPGSVPHEPGSLPPGYEHPAPLPPPPPPKIIPYDPTYVAAGPNLVKNRSFEKGNFGPGTETIVSSSGVIEDWRLIVNALNGPVRWIESFSSAAEGKRFVDLTGGRTLLTAPLATLLQTAPSYPLQSGQSYEVAVDLGVGPNNGPSENFGPPVVVSVSVIEPPGAVEWQFISNPLNPPVGTGVKWETHKFRFAIPAGYPLSPTNQTITITGNYGDRFIGVDNVSVRLLT